MDTQTFAVTKQKWQLCFIIIIILYLCHTGRLVLHQKHLRSEIITTVTMMNTVCVYVMLCSLTDCLLCPTLMLGVADSSEKWTNFSHANCHNLTQYSYKPSVLATCSTCFNQYDIPTCKCDHFIWQHSACVYDDRHLSLKL